MSKNETKIAIKDSWEEIQPNQIDRNQEIVCEHC